MKHRNAGQQAAINKALQYLDTARRKLQDGGEPALAMAVGGLLARIELSKGERLRSETT